jgi:hypothetical protein
MRQQVRKGRRTTAASEDAVIVEASDAAAAAEGLCVNCDYALATTECVECPSSQNRFCQECSRLHVRIKAFRGHTIKTTDQPSKPRICQNCDKNVATMVCTHCPESESLLCTDCSHLHKQIKMFRSHNVISAAAASARVAVRSAGLTPLKQLRNFFFSTTGVAADYYLVISEYVIENGLVQPSIAIFGGVMFLIIFLLRMFVGRNAVIFVLIFLIISIRYYMQFGRTELKVVCSWCHLNIV